MGATIDAATGAFAWTPAAGGAGMFDVTLEATGKSGKATQSWKVEVVSLGETMTTPPKTGCGCNEGASGIGWLALLALLGLVRVRGSWLLRH